MAAKTDGAKKKQKKKTEKEPDDAREKVGRGDKGRICLPSRCVSNPPASLISAARRRANGWNGKQAALKNTPRLQRNELAQAPVMPGLRQTEQHMLFSC